MRVCLIGPIPPFRGGIAKYCYSLAKELEKRHELLLLSYYRQYPALLYGKKPQLDDRIDRASIRREFKNLSFDIDSASPASWRTTARAIKAFDAELVILPWWVNYWAPMYLYLLNALKKSGIKVVFLCINVFEHEDNFLKRLVTREVLKRVDRLVVHSGQEREEILQFHPEAEVRTHLLPLFQYHDAPAPPRHDDLRLLFFGFVRPYKGLDTLLRALALIKDRPVSLKIAGEFWKDKDVYLKLVEELGLGDRVEVTDGYLSDEAMSRFFCDADLVVLPYKRSRTSGIIATAYGFRKPVLATRIGGFHEIVKDGYTGRLVAPDDPEAFAEGIRWFLERRSTDFAGNIEEFTRATMSWQSLVDVIEEFGIRT